jgi:hypothetical protein
MSCAGPNFMSAVPVPAANIDGPIMNVSGLVAGKTFYLADPFDGEYVILGSHDDSEFVPILQFNGQELRFGTSGPQMVRRDVIMTLKSIRVRRRANKLVTISIASQLVCPC